MSVYYDFYLGKKENDKIRLVGPIVDNKLHSFYNRSASFFNGDDIYDYMDRLPEQLIAEENIKDLGFTGLTNEYISSSFYIKLVDAVKLANPGLVKGYVTLDDLEYLSTNDYSEDAIDDVRIFKPDYIAELPTNKRKQYVLFAAVSTRGIKYVFNIASEIFDDLLFSDDKESYYIICNKG